MTTKKESKSKLNALVSSIYSDICSSTLINIIISSFKCFTNSWPWIFLSVLVDFIFLIATASVITLIQFTLFEHLEKIMELTGEVTGGLVNIYNQTATTSASMMSLPNNPDFQYHINIIVKYLGIMVLIAFVLWIIFQSISWYIAYRMATDKKSRLSFLRFWRDFAIKSLPFHFLTVLWIFLSIRILLSIKMSLTPWIGEDILNFLFVLFVIFTWYFGSLCYTVTTGNAWKDFKQSFVYGIKKFPKTIQTIIAVTVLFLIIDQILRIPFIAEDPFLKIILGTLTFMPMIVFARISLFKTTQTYWQTNKPASAKKK